VVDACEYDVGLALTGNNEEVSHVDAWEIDVDAVARSVFLVCRLRNKETATRGAKCHGSCEGERERRCDASLQHNSSVKSDFVRVAQYGTILTISPRFTRTAGREVYI